MRKFVDLNLRPLIRDIGQVETMVNKSSELGYHCVGISIPQGAKRKEIRMLEKICNDVGIDLATRVDLFPKTPRELLSNLRRVRRRFEVVSVICASKPVARQAAKDRRVDLLLFLYLPRIHLYLLNSLEYESCQQLSQTKPRPGR